MENYNSSDSPLEFILILFLVICFIYARIRFSNAPHVKRHLKKYLILGES